MSLREQQATFARLVTDDAFRAAARDGAVGADPALASAHTPTSIAGAAGVEQHAIALKRKRLGAARWRLPLTIAALGESLAPLFLEFAGTTTLCADRRYDRDALAFLVWLASDLGRVSCQQDQASRLRAVIRMERAELKARLGGRLLRLLPVDGRRLPVPSGLPRRRFVAIWLRLSPEGRMRRWTIGIPFTLEVNAAPLAGQSNPTDAPAAERACDHCANGIGAMSTSE